MTARQTLSEYFESTPVNNTHCHHLTAEYFDDISLNKLLSMSYVSWICPPFPDSAEGFETMREHMQCNSYGYWLLKAYAELYNGGKPLTGENFSQAEARVKEAYAKAPRHDLALLTDKCGYANIVLDNYSNPGSDSGVPNARPAFRCDMFLHAYSPDGEDQNHNNPFTHMGATPETFEAYIARMEECITRKIRKERCCAIKIAIAYERGLDFTAFDDEAARAAYRARTDNYHVKALQDVVMDRICKAAAKQNCPVQIHTGLGQLNATNAMRLLPLISRNPQTKFVIFHCSYPWTADVLALAHNFANVYPDLCWLPLLSTSAAERFLLEALDVTDAYRLTWGCDTWTSEESYGALLAIRYVLSKALAERVDEGLYTLDAAKELGINILYNNARRIYLFD